MLTPTLYPSSYPSNWLGFADPNDGAVEIVTAALREGQARIDGFAYFRPWLQTWTLDAGAQRDVQSAVTEGGMGWMLWSNSASYSASALPPR